MIKKTFILTLLLILGFNWLLSLFDGLEAKMHAGVYTRNNIRHESFLYADTTPKLVLVGSSVSANVNLSDFKGTYQNLSTEGGNVFSGLCLVNKKREKPQHILVEINSLIRSEDNVILAPYKNEILNDIKAKMPLFHSKNRIIDNQIVNSLFLFEYVINTLPDGKVVSDKKQFKGMKLGDISDLTININFKNLVTQINKLKEGGVKITFFELPYKTQKMTQKYDTFRMKIISYCKEHDIRIILSDSFKDIKFMDGVHMTVEASAKYSEWLNNEIGVSSSLYEER